MSFDIHQLKQLIASGKCVLFLGAGASLSSEDEFGFKAPTTSQLTKELATKFLGEEYDDENDLKSVAFYAIDQSSRREVNNYICSRLSGLRPSEGLRLIPSFKWRSIFTTNYDCLVEDAYRICSNPVQTLRPIISSSDLIDTSQEEIVYIHKLHGCIRHANSEQGKLVLTEDDYVRTMRWRKTLYARLAVDMASSHILYVGQSRTDHDLRAIMDVLQEDMGGIENIHRGYALWPGYRSYHFDTWASKKITLIDMTTDEFFRALDDLFENDEEKVPRKTRKFSVEIPQVFLENPSIDSSFAVNYATSLELVNELPQISEEPNTESFYKGDKPNWSIFDRGIDVARDKYEPFLEAIMDEEVLRPASRSAILLSAEAGAGKSTLCRRVAFDVAQHLSLPVFYLKPRARLNDDVIFKIYETYKRKIYLFIDNAADHVEYLHTFFNSPLMRTIPICFVLNERTNEWTDKIRGYDIPIRQVLTLDDLSSDEIRSILNKLAEHGLLGVLQFRTYEDRLKLFEQQARKQLLVALREVTEGNPFEEIIRDEARNISSELAQNAYIYICALYTFGIMIRTSLLCRLLGINLANLKQYVLDPAERIIISEEVNGDLHFRARHEKIAEIVYTRFVYSSEKRFSVIMDILDKLDIGYQSDLDAFKALTRNRKLADGLETYDRKKEFFDRIVEIDPTNIYGWQHYALMEIREVHPEKAARILETKALPLQPGNRLLRHTLGLAMANQGIKAENPYQSDRYFTEAQKHFEFCIRKAPADSYAYHSWASMLAHRAKVEQDHTIDYMKHAYDLLYDGIKKCSNPGTLYQELAHFEQMIQEWDVAENYYEKALQVEPKNITTLYLYSKFLYKQNRYQDAKKQLEKALGVDEYVPWINYLRGLTEIALDKDSNDAINLYLSRAADAHNNAHYKLVHAYYLYVMGDVKGSKLMLSSIDHSRLSKEERLKLCKAPTGLPRYIETEGTVCRLEQTFGFISRDFEADNVYFRPWRMSKEHRYSMAIGTRVKFFVVFGYLGPIAQNVRLT